MKTNPTSNSNSQLIQLLKTCLMYIAYVLQFAWNAWNPPVSIRWACAYSSSLSLCTSFISSLKPSQQIKPTAKNYKPTTSSYSNTIAKQLQRCTKPERGVQLKTDPLPNFMLATAKVLPWKYSFIYSLSCPLWFLYLFRAPPLPVVAWPHFVK